MSSHHPHHQAIAFILDSLDVDLFKAAGACFGGDTLITLLHDEFRFSKDIDFMCPVPDTAIEKAESAYPVKEPLRKVILKFQGSKTYRDKCFDALEIKDRSMVLDGLDLLAADFEVPITNRDPAEEDNKYLD